MQISGTSRFILLSCLLLGIFEASSAASFSSYQSMNIELRGKSQTLAVYEPAPGTPRRPVQVIVTSGDVGWVGLPVDIAEHLQKAGYRTIGFNARAYLSSFTQKNSHLEERDIPGDYQALQSWAAAGKGPAEFVMIGVSEGAGLAVIGMSGRESRNRCKGIIAMGLPGKTSLGWRWTDFPMWITKKDPNEPLADTRGYLKNLDVPLVMIHSMHDEWDSIESAREMFQIHPGPKKLITIDAINHRFSNKVPEALLNLEKSLDWIQNPEKE